MVIYILGVLIGFSIRPIFYVLTGKDVPLISPEFEKLELLCIMYLFEEALQNENLDPAQRAVCEAVVKKINGVLSHDT